VDGGLEMTQGDHQRKSDVLRIFLLGEFRVELGIRTVDDAAWHLRKARSLIKILALTPEHRLHRESLMELLWPGVSPVSALGSLNQVLYAARQALLGLYDSDLKPNEVIRHHNQMVSLSPSGPLWIDAEVFESRAREAILTGDERVFDEAVALYGGDLLPEDRYEDWAGEHRERLNALFVSLLHEFAIRFGSWGDLPRSIDALQRSLLADPEREDTHAELMRYYALSGHKQQAIQQFEQLTTMLRRKYDVEPGQNTVVLYHDIIEGRISAPRPIAPVVEDHSSSIFGRDSEMSALSDAVRAGLAGQGRVLLLAGDAGIGKTTLAERVSDPLKRAGEALVYWGRCSRNEGVPAYWPWVQIFREYLEDHTDEVIERDLGRHALALQQIVPGVGEGLSHASGESASHNSRFLLFDAVSNVLKRIAERRPLLLVLDDLHWADRSSLLLLEHVSQDFRSSPVVVLGTYRDVDLDRNHPLHHTIGQLARHPHSRPVLLSGLQREDAVRLIAVASGVEPPDDLVSAIYELTEGNPFFMNEIIHLLIQQGDLEKDPDWSVPELAVPLGIREVMHQRLERLSNDARTLLSIGSVIGREFGVHVLHLVSSVSQDRLVGVLEEAVDARILVEKPNEPGHYRFSHALIRETIYDDIGTARRTQLHGLIGEALERVYSGNIDAHLSELAHHFYRATPRSDNAKTVNYLSRAGDVCMRQVGFDEASIVFGRALNVLDLAAPVDYPRRCRLLLSLADAQRGAGDSARSRETSLQAATLAQRLGLSEELAHAAATVAWASMEIRPYDAQVVRLLEDALDALGPDDSIHRVQVLGALVRALDYSGDVERRTRLGEEAVAVARRLNDPETLVHALEGRMKSAIRPENLDQTVADAEEIIRVAALVGNSYMMILGHWWRIDGLLGKGDMAAVDQSIAIGTRLAYERGEPRRVWEALCYQTMRALLSGRYEEAERLATEAVQVGQRPAPRPSWSTYIEHMFIIRCEQGRLDDLESDLRELVANYGNYPYYHAMLAVLLVDIGRRDEALEVFERLSARNFQDVPRDLLWLVTIALLSELAFHFDDAPRAEVLYEMLKHFPDRAVVPDAIEFCLGSSSHYIGLLAQTIGLQDEACHAFESAIAMNADMGARPYLAHSCYVFGRWHLQPGRSEDAEQALALVNQALEIANAHQMSRLARQCVQLRGAIQQGDGHVGCT
jgi:eukaryotic-like serine/threonine-protein kinase